MDEYDDYFEETYEEEEEEVDEELLLHNLECKIDDMIYDIFNEVILPYLESYNKEILTDLDQFSSHKLYHFFIDNSQYYKRLINYKRIISNKK